ncbi:MAG: tRNA pseudouridine(55) synthase TruB [Armatimonadota bacterium]|nr:tRNA pseudouridine(55) synthase TruB [Armatimonadota bacterium]
MDGVLNLDKPAGVTSHDVVNRVRRIVGIRRVGHAGTLDPLATGVLLVCVGQATRIVEYLMDAEKEYEGTMVLGASTDTEDSSGAIHSEADASAITNERIARVLPRFTGQIPQTPPMVSAAHYQGERLYKLARDGITVPREPRQVTVKEIELLEFEPGVRARAKLRVVCSKGVYIRTLFADIGAALGVGAHMSQLRRTRIGRFVIAEAVNLDALAQIEECGRLGDALIPMTDALAEFPEIVISSEAFENVRRGRMIPAPDDISGGLLIRLTRGNALVGLAKVVRSGEGVALQPVKVFV